MTLGDSRAPGPANSLGPRSRALGYRAIFAREPVIAVGRNPQRELFARNVLQEILDILAHPRQRCDGTGRRTTRVLAVGHERDEVSGLGQRGEIIACAPAVLQEAMISGGTGSVFSAMDDCNAERESAAMQRRCRLTVPGSKEIAILDVDVLDVELDSPEPAVPAELDERTHRPSPSRGVGEQSPQRRLVEALVDDQGHHLHSVPTSQGQHSTVEASPYDAEAVHGVDLGAQHGDLIDVLGEAGIAVLGVDVVEQSLERLLRPGGGRRERQATQANPDVAEHTVRRTSL